MRYLLWYHNHYKHNNHFFPLPLILMASSSNSDTSLIVFNISNFVSIKLDRTNYPMFFLKDDEGKITYEVDPKIERWIAQDQIIFNWINPTLTPKVLSIVALSTSSQST